MIIIANRISKCHLPDSITSWRWGCRWSFSPEVAARGFREVFREEFFGKKCEVKNTGRVDGRGKVGESWVKMKDDDERREEEAIIFRLLWDEDGDHLWGWFFSPFNLYDVLHLPSHLRGHHECFFQTAAFNFLLSRWVWSQFFLSHDHHYHHLHISSFSFAASDKCKELKVCKEEHQSGSSFLNDFSFCASSRRCAPLYSFLSSPHLTSEPLSSSSSYALCMILLLFE